jgi:hypothetical protein
LGPGNGKSGQAKGFYMSLFKISSEDVAFQKKGGSEKGGINAC